MKVKVGDKFPNLAMTDVFGNTVNVEEIDAEKTMIWVFRYVGCPICQLDMHEMSLEYDKVKEKGCALYVVLQSDVEHTKAYLEQNPMPFTLILDPEMKIYKELEVEPASSKISFPGNLPKVMGKVKKAGKLGFEHGDYEGDEMQLPALFILDQDKTVTYAHYAKSLSDMPEVSEMIALL